MYAIAGHIVNAQAAAGISRRRLWHGGPNARKRWSIIPARQSTEARGDESVADVQYHDRMRTRPPSGEAVAPIGDLRPEQKVLHGDYCTLEPLDASRHADDLFAASHGQPGQEHLWDWLPAG